jgi:hypothetical protein
MGHFWSNTVWFVLLGITTLLELALIFYRAENRRLTLGLYLSVSGFVFGLEMAVYSYLKAYTYSPMVFPQSPPDDCVAGNLFSQFSIAATGLLIGVYNLKYYWMLFFAAVYGGIEYLFLRLGIYQQNWYQTWMTILGLLPLFWLFKTVYRKAQERIAPFLRYVYVFYGLLALHQHLVIWPMRLTGIYTFSESFLPDKEKSMVVLTALNLLIMAAAILMVWFSRMRWRWKAPVIIGLYAYKFLFAKYGLAHIKPGWFFITTSLCVWSLYLFTWLMDKLLTPPKPSLKQE